MTVVTVFHATQQYDLSMKRSRNLEVTTWSATSEPIEYAPSAASRSALLSPARSAGILGSIVVHVFVAYFVGVLTWTKPAITRKPVTPPQNFKPTSLTLVAFVENGESNLHSVQLTAPATISAITADLITVDAPTTPHFEIENEADNGAANAGVNDSRSADLQAHLSTIYSGQIFARVERIWLRPKTPVTQSPIARSLTADTESFRCTVKVDQMPNGQVQSINVLQCNGTLAWRESLVTAIWQASPLPAPPDSSIFKKSIMLTFIEGHFRSDDPVRNPHARAFVALPASPPKT